MMTVTNVLIIGSVILAVSGASLSDKSLYDLPRINNGDQLISSVINDCFDGNTMTCLKGKVLTYLDSILNLREEKERSFVENNVDSVIMDRVGRILATHEIKVTLPETIFQKTVLSYRPDNGFNINVPEDVAEEGIFNFYLF